MELFQGAAGQRIGRKELVMMMKVNKPVKAFGFNFKKGFFVGRDAEGNLVASSGWQWVTDEGNLVFIYRQTAAGEWVGDWEELEDFPGIPELVEEEEDLL